MKKITLFILAIGFTVGAMAQTNSKIPLILPPDLPQNYYSTKDSTLHAYPTDTIYNDISYKKFIKRLNDSTLLSCAQESNTKAVRFYLIDNYF